MFDNNTSDHVVQCSFEECFSALPADAKWSAAAAESIKRQLVSKKSYSEPPIDADGNKVWSYDTKQVSQFGWKAWRAAMLAKDQCENARYKSIVDMFLDICNVAYSLDPQLYANQTAYFHHTVCTPTKNDVAGHCHDLLDWRSTKLPEPKVQRYPTRERPRVAVNPKGLSQKMSDCMSFAQFKKYEEDTSKNERHLFTVASELMHNDPNRRFVCGMTIEAQSVRFWRFDRGLILASERFDFNDKPEYLIRIALYFSYATATQAGFDPTVRPFYVPPATPAKCKASAASANRDTATMSDPAASSTPNPDTSTAPAGCHSTVPPSAAGPTAEPANASPNKGSNVFIYEINGRYFRTRGKPLSEGSAYTITPRGVRVWSVIECDAGGEDLPGGSKGVLKDFWQHVGGKSEKDLQDCVFERLAELDKTDPVTGDALTRVKQMEGYFLTIIECETVTIDGQVDTTAAKPGAEGTMRNLPNTDQGSSDMSHHEFPDAEGIQHRQRVHWRYVVEEECETMYTVRNFKAVFEAGRDIANALNLFRQAGYLHRDISGGNCMVYRDPVTGKYQGKLADLEFCKAYSTVSRRDAATGTMEFMPVEHTFKDWMSRPTLQSDSIDSLPDLPDDWDPMLMVYYRHPYHDLESLYWVMIWGIVAYFPISDPPYRHMPWEWDKWWSYKSTLFNDFIFGKWNLFKRPVALYQNMRAWGWDNKTALALWDIISFSVTIQNEYTHIQTQPHSDNSKWPISLFKGDIYAEFASRLDAASKGLASGDVVPMKQLKPTTPPKVTVKRANDSADDDAPDAKRPAL